MLLASVEWSRGIEDAWSKLATFAPKLIGCLVVFIIGLIVAKVLRRIVTRILSAAKVDSLVNRSGFGATLQRNSIGSPSELIAKVIYIGLVLLVVQLAMGALGPNPVSAALLSMIAFVPKIAVALIIVFVTGIVADKVGDVVRQVTGEQSYGTAVKKVAVAAIWLIGGFAALDQIEVARNVVDTLFKTLVSSLGAIVVIKFGVGGVWAARDRFWPKVYDGFGMKDPQETKP
jgi:Conserved TM helix